MWHTAHLVNCGVATLEQVAQKASVNSQPPTPTSKRRESLRSLERGCWELEVAVSSCVFHHPGRALRGASLHTRAAKALLLPPCTRASSPGSAPPFSWSSWRVS